MDSPGTLKICKMKNNQQPGLFYSLYLSCSSTAFYSSISSISWWRSLLFLALYSFLGALGLVFLLYRSIFLVSDPQEDILTLYDQVIPSFEGAYSDGNLETDPHEFSFVIGLDEGSEFYLKNKPQRDAVLEYAVEVDTLRTTSEREENLLGLGLYRDGIGINSGFGIERLSFQELDIEGDFVVNKQIIRAGLLGALPEILSSVKSFLIFGGPPLLTLYLILSGLFQALLFSFFGCLSMLMRGAQFKYGDLIKISLHAGFPALLFLVSSLLLGIPVSWLPVMIHALFYFIGLHYYRARTSIH